MPKLPDWLEDDDEFEGVGAHPLNPRYDPVDEDEPSRHLASVAPLRLARVQSFLAAVPPYRLDGHDGSHHQFDAGPVNLDALSAATWIIWWKATQSISYVDPTFAQVWLRRSLWTHRHAYHWLSSTTDPEQQAAHFLATVNAQGGFTPGDNGMGDFEEAGITVDWCLGFMEYVEARRKLPMSPYSGLFVAGGTIWNDDRMRESKYGPRPMHLAAYVTEEQLAQIMAQRNAKPFDAWQYSSNGPVPGITGRADMNRVDNRAVYDLACGVTTAPAPQPLPGDDMQNYYVVTDANARFIGTPALVRWTGPGDDKVQKAIDVQLAAGNLTKVELTGGPNAFASTLLDGPLPTGDTVHTWDGSEFANEAEIKARQANGGDQIARDGLVKINDALAKLGQRDSDAGLHLERAAAALRGN